MRTGIVLLNFGEPERATLDEVVPFLESIFTANFRLEHASDPAAGRQRARELAENRGAALVDDYKKMGGSPLRRQTETQGRALDAELRGRGQDVIVGIGMQFGAPSIEDAVAAMSEGKIDRLVALPMYPLCGPSTTIFSLEALQRVLRSTGWSLPVTEVAGWQAHPAYTRVWARAVRRSCEKGGVDITDPRTHLLFSAHGTPIRYLDEGSRYDAYVRSHCKRLSEQLGVQTYTIGYQNHANRPGIEWTQPAVSDALEKIDADSVVVVPVSFMQELSETLVELDVDLQTTAASLGLRFHRVPVPYADPKFIALLADVVEEAMVSRGECRCRPGAYCVNQKTDAREV